MEAEPTVDAQIVNDGSSIRFVRVTVLDTPHDVCRSYEMPLWKFVEEATKIFVFAPSDMLKIMGPNLVR